VATESITWPTPPDDTDENDGTQAYNLGREFTLTAERPIVGIEWRVPDSVANPQGGPHAVGLWDGVTRLAYLEVAPTPGGVRQFLFDAEDQVAGAIGTVYTASVYTNHYAFSSGADVGSTSPSGEIIAGDSMLVPFNGGAALAPLPDNVSGANFYISPITSDEVPDDHTTTGTAPATATAPATSTTLRPTTGTAPATASASATSGSTRTTATSAPALATASATSTTQRPTVGSAPASTSARAASATARTTAGSARLIATASGYVAAGTAAPRLVTRSGPGPLVTRTPGIGRKRAMRRYNVGDPVALRYVATDADTGAPVAVSGTLVMTKPDGTTYEGVVQSGGEGILDVTVPSAQVAAEGVYEYVWEVTGGLDGTEEGRFYVSAEADELPPLATVEDLRRKLGYLPEDSERDRAEHLLDEASELIRDKAGVTWTNAATGALESVPRRVRLICVAAAYRAFTNPEGLTQRTIGDSSKAYDRAKREGGEDVYLTEAEVRTIRKAAGTSSLVSVTLVSPYESSLTDPWDAVTAE
jgi:hypothetical protein